MTAKEDSENRSYYQELKAQNEQMRSKLSVLENEGFLLKPNVDVENLYMYLKKNPTSAQFIYQKYVSVRDILKEICNQKNPLYIEDVANELKDLITISDLKEDVESIRRERSNLIGQISELKNELLEKNKEVDSLESKVPELTKQLDNMQKLLGNLTQEETITRIKSFYESVGTFVDGVLESRKKEPITESFNSARLDLNQLNVLRLLQKTVKADLDFILNQDLLSEENLDAKRKEIKEKMEKEMEEGETAMDAFRLHNPLKTLNKSVSKIEEAQEQLANAGEFSRDSGWFYNIHTIPNIQAILDIPKELLNNLVQQVNNVNARKKTG